jgi:hypothetical protein
MKEWIDQQRVIFALEAKMLRVNWQRGVYLALFFCNAVFATLFRSLGDGAHLL